MKQKLWWSTMVVLAAGAPLTALASDYPTRPIQMIVPFAPGGGADMVARVIGQKVGEAWGQPVVVENRPGASGNIGASAVAKAPPDGYTLLMASSAFVINPSFDPNTPYDPLVDFAPISQPALLPNILVVHPSLPVTTVDGLIDYVANHPTGVNYASAGTATGTHLAGEMFKLQADVDMLHVPYKGGGAVLTDLLAGRVDLTFATLPSVMAHVNSGDLRPIAMTTRNRWPDLPEVPTLMESGLEDFEINTWIGLLAPAGTPQAVIDKWHSEIVRVLELPDVQERFASLGMDRVGDTPAEFRAQIERELADYRALVEAAGIQSE